MTCHLAGSGHMRVQLYRDDAGALWVDSSRSQSSGALSSIANADGLAVLRASEPARKRGEPIDVIVLNSSFDRTS